VSSLSLPPALAREIGDPKKLVLAMAARGLIERPWPEPPETKIPAWLKRSFVAANHHKPWPESRVKILARRLDRSVPESL